MRGFLGLLDADVVENTPWTLPKGSRDLRSLRMLHNFRLCTPKRTPKGVNWAWVTCGSPVTTTKKKKRGKKPGMRRTYFRSRDFVTSGQKTPLGRIWRDFRLRMRRTYFRRGSLRSHDWCHFRSRDWRHFRSHHLKCGFVRTHILLSWWWSQLPMQSVPITTDVASSNLDQGEVYNIMW
jgi:hypothetical protein